MSVLRETLRVHIEYIPLHAKKIPNFFVFEICFYIPCAYAPMISFGFSNKLQKIRIKLGFIFLDWITGYNSSLYRPNQLLDTYLGAIPNMPLPTNILLLHSTTSPNTILLVLGLSSIRMPMQFQPLPSLVSSTMIPIECSTRW
jgi:hypothetical protein